MAPPSIPPVLAGYEYVRPLGSGGFGDVFLYRQLSPDRLVAIKVLRRHVTGSAVRQLLGEARALAQLSTHPRIVTIYEQALAPDARPYLVMAYCPGGSLAARLASGPLPPQEVAAIGAQLADALAAAHAAGIVHRDVKPANVLVTQAGTPALADFGIAARSTSGGKAFSLPWAAPEAIEGTASPAGDLYSLAATLVTLLTGRPPAQGHGPAPSRDELRERILTGRLEPIPTRVGSQPVPRELQTLLRDCLALAPSNRPESARQVAERLRRLRWSGAQVEPADGVATQSAQRPAEGWSIQDAPTQVASPRPSRLRRPLVLAVALALPVGAVVAATQLLRDQEAAAERVAATYSPLAATSSSSPSPSPSRALSYGDYDEFGPDVTQADFEAVVPDGPRQRLPSLLPDDVHVTRDGADLAVTWTSRAGATYRRLTDYAPLERLDTVPVTSPYLMPAGSDECLSMYAVTEDGTISDGVLEACGDDVDNAAGARSWTWIDWLVRHANKS